MKLPAIISVLTLVAAMPALAQSEPANPFVAGMRSVKIEAQDFARSIAFYTALGMKAGTRREATQDLTWDGPTQNSGIVMTTTAYAQRAQMVRGGTYMMIMTPDTNAAVARLRAAGFGDVPEPKAMGTMVSYVILRDPDGNRIELMGPPSAR